MADLITLFGKAADHFGEAVRAVRDDQWKGDTPCTEWDVRALVKHLVYELVWMRPMLEGQTIAEVGDRFEGDLLGNDPSGAWDGAAADAREAVSAPGALEATAHLSFGDFPGSEYIMQVLFDLFIHNWDLRTAIGADATMDPEVMSFISPWWADRVEAYRAAGAIGEAPPVQEGSSEQTRLLALTGRKG